MKFVLLFGLIGLSAAGVIQIDLDQEWTDFKQRYAKSYRHDTEEVILDQIFSEFKFLFLFKTTENNYAYTLMIFNFKAFKGPLY
jgi:hypothetical protein